MKKKVDLTLLRLFFTEMLPSSLIFRLGYERYQQRNDIIQNNIHPVIHKHYFIFSNCQIPNQNATLL